MVSEGVGDGLVAAQAGLPTVAVLGCQYPDAHVADTIAATRDRSPRLRTATVVVCFDGDDAGRHSSERLGALLDERNVPHRVLPPPDGVDLSAWAAADPGWIGHLASPCTPTVAAAPLAPPGRGLGLGIPGPG